MKETDVRFSYSSIGFPHRAFTWSNGHFIEWAKDTGYSSAEFLPFRNASTELLIKNINIISSINFIKSGHVVYNPYATIWSVINKETDPLRKNVPFGTYNLAFVEKKNAQKVLNKLENNLDNFYVVTYPYEVNGKRPYGEYKNPVVQTHPAVFNSNNSADELIKFVRQGKYSGVAWDTFHALETTADGTQPFRNWRIALHKLLEANVIKEVHIQTVRIREKYSPVPDMSWLKGMTGENPKYNNELGQMIRIVKEYNTSIPFVIEINTGSLIKAGLINDKNEMSADINKIQQIHGQLIDYIKRG